MRLQVIKFFDGKETILEDDEAENVKAFWLESSEQPIRLRNGTVLNPKSIASIGVPDTLPMWGGYPLAKDGNGFWRDGEYCQFEPHNYQEITHHLNPKYGRGVPQIELDQKPALTSGIIS